MFCDGHSLVSYKTDLAILGSDHCPLLVDFNFCNSSHSILFNLPIICVSKCNDLVLSKIIKNINILDIDRRSVCDNDFFVALEIRMLAEFSKNNLLKFRNDKRFDLKHFSSLDACKIIKNAVSRSDRLKFIKMLTADKSSGFDFEKVAEALIKAEQGECLPQLINHNFNHKRVRHHLFFTPEEIKEKIVKLNVNKSVGLSCVSARLLKLTPHVWHSVLAARFNSISVNSYPVVFRIRKLVGVPKSDGSPRPIAVLAALCKIYDMGLNERLQSAAGKLLPKSQTAYQENVRGCEENIFTAKALVQKYPHIVLMFADFSKAFNSMPNLVIEDSLAVLGISDALIAAVLDSIEYYAVCDLETGKFVKLVRGQPQGSCQSGFIFLLCIRRLSLELDAFPKENPLFIGKTPICHLGFADDKVLAALGLRDSTVLCRVLIAWSIKVGMPLNIGKCKFICRENLILPFKKCNSYKYLGVTISLDKNNFTFTRPYNSNNLIACRISDTLSSIPNVSSFRDILRSFHMGPFALHIAYSDKFRLCKTIGDVTSSFTKFDSHWINLSKNFCGLGNNDKCFLSINRIASEFRLAFYRAGPALIRYTFSFIEYLQSRPTDCYANIVLSDESNLDVCQDILYAYHTLAPLAKSIPKFPVIENHWSCCRLNIRKRIAYFFLSVDHENFGEIRDSIRVLVHGKKFCELKELLDSIDV